MSVFTGGLIGPPGTRFQYPGSLAGMQAFLGAGDPDPHVPWERVEASASVLSEMGANVTLRRYPGMPHTISENEIKSARPIIEGLDDAAQEDCLITLVVCKLRHPAWHTGHCHSDQERFALDSCSCYDPSPTSLAPPLSPAGSLSPFPVD
jgi:hypothetical protein